MTRTEVQYTAGICIIILREFELCHQNFCVGPERIFVRKIWSSSIRRSTMAVTLSNVKDEETRRDEAVLPFSMKYNVKAFATTGSTEPRVKHNNGSNMQRGIRSPLRQNQ